MASLPEVRSWAGRRETAATSLPSFCWNRRSTGLCVLPLNIGLYL